MCASFIFSFFEYWYYMPRHIVPNHTIGRVSKLLKTTKTFSFSPFHGQSIIKMNSQMLAYNEAHHMFSTAIFVKNKKKTLSMDWQKASSQMNIRAQKKNLI